jgi:DNA mismatch repair protein MutS2
VNEEWERLRKSDRTRAALEQSRRRVNEAAGRIDRAAGAEALETLSTGPAGPGDRVEIAHLGMKGTVAAVDGGTATVQAGSVTVKVPLQALRTLGGAGGAPGAPDPQGKDGPGSRASDGRGGSGGAAASGAGAPAVPGWSAGRGGVELPERGRVASELHLIGKTTDEARDLLEEYLDDAFLAGLPAVRIIHGKGTGALRRAVEDVLSGHPLVAEHRAGAPSEGGGGATVAVLGQS